MVLEAMPEPSHPSACGGAAPREEGLSRRAFLQRAGGASLSLAAGTRAAAYGEPRSENEPFRIQRVSEHVFAAVAQPTPIVNGNAVFIVTRQGLIVVDAPSSPSAARSAYRQFGREVAELPVRFLIDTHHHGDHAHGNRAYLDLFGSRPDVLSTRFARAALAQAGRWLRAFLREEPPPPMALDEVAGQDGYYALLDNLFGGLRRELRAATPDERASRPRLRAIAAYFDEMAGFQPLLPNVTFEKRLELHAGDLDLQILHLGRAHTAGDAIVYVPQDGVVITGDVAHGIDPLFFEAFPDEWPATLARIAALDFETLVPAHGPVQKGRATLAHFTDYVSEMDRRVREGVEAGKGLSTLLEELPPARFRSLEAGGFGQAMQRNREALLGLDPGQPLGPVVAYGVEQVFRYYTARKHRVVPA